MKIYFKINNDIKDFYFFELGKDDSIYFGTSASKFFTKRFCGSGKTDGINGAYINFVNDLRPVPCDKVCDKYSFHKSGFIYTPTMEDGIRHRYKTLELSKYNEPIPLVGILPIEINKYKNTRNLIKKEDFIINFGQFVIPFGILFYLKKTNQDDPPVVKNVKWDMSAIVNVNIFPYILGILIYRNKKFVAWPSTQVTVIAHPDINTGKIPFPIFEDLTQK